VRYQDYRQMLERQKDIDAVVIATPDHMHGDDRAGGDGSRQARYVQKPLTWSVAEPATLRAGEEYPRRHADGQPGTTRGTMRGPRVETCGRRDRRREGSARLDETGRSAMAQGIASEAKTPPPSGFRWNGPGLESRSPRRWPATIPAGKARVDLFLGVAAVRRYNPSITVQLARLDGLGLRRDSGDMGAHLMDHSCGR